MSGGFIKQKKFQWGAKGQACSCLIWNRHLTMWQVRMNTYVCHCCWHAKWWVSKQRRGGRARKSECREERSRRRNSVKQKLKKKRKRKWVTCESSWEPFSNQAKKVCFQRWPPVSYLFLNQYVTFVEWWGCRRGWISLQLIGISTFFREVTQFSPQALTSLGDRRPQGAPPTHDSWGDVGAPWGSWTIDSGSPLWPHLRHVFMENVKL